jgi:hypothetical protein
MSTTMTRYPLTLTNPQIAWLEAEADDLGISRAELARRIIDEYRFKTDRERGFTHAARGFNSQGDSEVVE